MFTASRQHAYAIGEYPYQMRKSVGDRIKELRESAGWSQAELARRIRVSRPTVTQWESGSTKNVREDNLIALARAFSVTVDELLTGEAPQGVRESREAYGASAESREEEVLLAKYRHLNPDDRARIQKIVAALDAEADGEVGNGGD